MALSPVPSTKLVVALMLDSVKALEMVTEILLVTATETAIALAVKGAQLLRVVALVVPTQKAPALTVAARAIAVAVPEIAAAIAVQGLRRGVMRHVVIVVRNSEAQGAKLF